MISIKCLYYQVTFYGEDSSFVLEIERFRFENKATSWRLQLGLMKYRESIDLIQKLLWTTYPKNKLIIYHKESQNI